jgi:hypothetical protein
MEDVLALLNIWAIPVLWSVMAYEAWLCASGQKLTVLYLRRFRLGPAQAVVTAALEQGLGKHYRVVTLDDASFPPMEVPRLYRRFSRYGGLAIWSIGMIVFFFIVTVLVASSGPTILGAIAGLMLAGMSFLMPGAPIVFSAALFVVSAALLLQRWRVRRRSKLSALSAADMDCCEQAVAELASWSKRSAWNAPRVTIVKVSDTLWRLVVARLVGRANVVLFDLSESTANMEWEFALLAQRSFKHTVFIANAEAPTTLQPPDGRSCVLYKDFRERAGRRSFLAALTRELEMHAKPLPIYRISDVIRPAATCLRTLVVLGLFLALSTVVLNFLFSSVSAAFGE